jgi:hypothetical protein
MFLRTYLKTIIHMDHALEFYKVMAITTALCGSEGWIFTIHKAE